ncbi:hypothetical protein [Streptomyces sp. NPDC007074]|uniref:hypothetical protein n=1 Tax=Streptomyces sp. NPDC007074 TaxID=3156764 RepID=UPI0034076FA9
MPEPDDPRFEWIWTPEVGGNEDQWIRGRCKHLTPLPVHAYPTDELVAHLCPDCDAQLPADWAPLRHSIQAPAGLVMKPSPHIGGLEIGPTSVARPRPFLLEPGERLISLRRDNGARSSG